MAKVLDAESRKAVAATLRYYRELGIFDLYRREAPEGVNWGRTIVREELAVIAVDAPAAETSSGAEAAVNAGQLAAVLNDKVGAWATDELNHAIGFWRKVFRGDAPIKNDTEISDADITELEVPTGIPFRMLLNDDLTVHSSRYLGDPAAAAEAAAAVKRQAG